MKTKKTEEDIKTKNIQELKSLLKEARSVLFNLRMDKAQNKLKNTSAIFLKRKEIARILTSLREKEI